MISNGEYPAKCRNQAIDVSWIANNDKQRIKGCNSKIWSNSFEKKTSRRNKLANSSIFISFIQGEG